MDKDRLIYADELQKHFSSMQQYDKCACNFEDNRGEPSTNWYCVESALENTATVPSITIGWLDEQIRGYSSRLQSTELKALILVKQLWEKSQEDDSDGYGKKV